MKTISDVKLNHMVQKILRLIDKKQPTLIFDDIPVLGSSNPVTSDGIAKALSSGSGSINHDTDPFIERMVEIVPVNFDNAYSISWESGNYNDDFRYYTVLTKELPIPIYLDRYGYEFKIKYYGLAATWPSNLNETSIEGLCFDLLDNNENDYVSSYNICSAPLYTGDGNVEINKDMIKPAENTVLLRLNNESDTNYNNFLGYNKGQFENSINIKTSSLAQVSSQMNYINLYVPSVDADSTKVTYGTYGITFTYKAIPY